MLQALEARVLRISAISILSFGLAACGLYDLWADGLRHSSAVASHLGTSFGVAPTVSFGWSNGRFQHVTVLFPRVIDDRPLPEIAAAARSAIAAEFGQLPSTVVVSFAVPPGDAGRTPPAH